LAAIARLRTMAARTGHRGDATRRSRSIEMPRRARSRWASAAAALSLVVGAGAPALGPFEPRIETRVRALSELENGPTYNIECDPSPNADPENEGCDCEPGVDYGPSAVCVDESLYSFTSHPSALLEADSFACPTDQCAITPLPDNGLGLAKTSYGSNYVDVFSYASSIEPYVYDSAAAASAWFDELTLTTEEPIPAAPIRAIFRVRGAWQNHACFVVHAQIAHNAFPPTTGRRVRFANTSSPPDVACIMDGLTPVPAGFTDFDADDGQIDLAIPLDITIDLPTSLILWGELRAFAASTEARLAGPDGGLEMTVERIEVPFGVEASSAAGALGAYSVPEPAATSSATIAIAAIAARRRHSAAKSSASSAPSP
jgi:hypothetical protein